MNLVVNASPVIFLSKIEMIDYLPEMVEHLTIPQAVIHEIEQHRDEAFFWIKQNKKKFSVKAESITTSVSAWDLGLGETEVITFASEHKDFTAALDDKAARNCAKSFQIPVIGTIGLIIRAKKSRVIDDAKPYLLKLKETGFRINDYLFDYALKLAD
jgi:predicted nucleic acid-binding protein